MAKLQVVDQNNKKVGDIELAPEVSRLKFSLKSSTWSFVTSVQLCARVPTLLRTAL